MKKQLVLLACSLLVGTIHATAQNGIITTIAGGVPFTFPTGVTSSANAPLGYLSALTLDSRGNIYAADRSSGFVFQVTSAGAFRIIAGNGSSGFSGDGGPATAASLGFVSAMVVDSAGNLFIADDFRVRKVSPAGTITTVAGTGGYGSSGDGGPALSATFSGVGGLASDAAGNLFMADSQNNRIRRLSATGIVTTIAGTGITGFSGDGGQATTATLGYPRGLALDLAGNLLVADTYNSRVRRISTNGIITTVAGKGTYGFTGDGGPATSASMYSPGAIAVDNVGNLLIGDADRIRRVTTAGIISTVAGTGFGGYTGDGGQATAATFDGPNGVAVDGSGNIFVSDSNNRRVRKIGTTGIISTVAGNGNYGFSGDGGPATAASFSGFGGLAVDAAGNLFVSDSGNNRVRKISTNGVVTTVAGNGNRAFSGDGGPATSAALNQPSNLVVDTAGNLFIADYSNYRVRKVSTAGVITTVAGNGAYGNSGDGGPATSAAVTPYVLAIDSGGNLLISDGSRVRRISTTGVITNVAGPGQSNSLGDGGPATSASFSDIQGLASDPAGNILIADAYNHRVRKVANGIITTLAGTGTYGSAGDGGPAASAWISKPANLAVDFAGNLLTSTGCRVRGVSSSGIIATAVGSALCGSSGDGGPATAARLSYPQSIAADRSGSLFIVDYDRIRKVSPPAPSLTVYPSSQSLALAAGTSASQSILLAGTVPSLAWTATSSASWLTLSASGGSSSATLTATARTTALQPGSYSAIVTISNPAAIQTQETVTVGLVVSATPTLSVTPTELHLQSQPRTGVQSQLIQVGGTIGTAWQASANTTTGGSWLSVLSSSGQIPAVLNVSANPAGLAPGIYQGSVTVRASGATPSSSTTNISLTVADTGPKSDPQVFSANNSANYKTTIAQGSLFVVFGDALGPGTLAQVSAFPLPSVLSGTSVTLESGSTTLNCPMIYTSGGQVAAILPSNAPLGLALIKIAYDGIPASGYRGSAYINVVKNSPGIFTTNSRGSGVGVFTAGDGSIKSYANSAKPGDTLTLWATGLGPISSPDSVLPSSYPSFPNVQVWVGGQPAEVLYAGRSGCCAAIDQIAFKVPAVANNCNVPVVLVSGGTSSNTAALPVGDAGGACADTGPTVPTGVLTKTANGQPVKLAFIGVGPAVFGSSNLSPAAVAERLSTVLGTRVSNADAAKLVKAYAARNPKALRLAMVKYAARWKALDSRKKSNVVQELGGVPQGAVALFGGFSNEGVAAVIATSQLPVAGSCVVLPANFPTSLGAIKATLDAGPTLFLTGAAKSYVMRPSHVGQYRTAFDSSLTGPNIPQGAYTLSGTGGKDLGAFSATISVGPSLALTSPASLASIDRTQALTVTWSGGSQGQYVLIAGGSRGGYADGTNIPATRFACTADASTGSFAIPAYILGSMNASDTGKARLGISPHPLSNPVTIPGIDLAYFVDGSSDEVSVTFK